MSKELSESGGHGVPAAHIEHLNSEPFVQEFLHLVDEGWEPDLQEFVDRVPESIREEVFRRLDEGLEGRTVQTWDENEVLAENHVLRQSLGDDSPESILAAALDVPQGPVPADHIAAEDRRAPTIIAIGEPMEELGERFAPARPALRQERQQEPEPDPEPAPALELDSEAEPEPEPEPEAEAEADPDPDPEQPEEYADWSVTDPAAALSSVAGMDLQRDLGRGSLGESFLAIDAFGARKSITIASADTPAKVLERLYREAAKVKALRVDQLVAIEETKHEPSAAVVISPFIEGDPIDLAAVDVDIDDRVRYLQMVVEALASAHAAGLLHLDLKPSNILVTPQGDVRLLDCGVGVAVLAVPERMAKLAGLGHYASPEHGRRARLSAASDIFSVGSLMYRMLTGKLPFPGGAPDLIRERIDAAEPILPRLHDDRIPVVLQDICLACLARNPADRPDAGTLIASLDRYLVGRPVSLRPALYRALLRRESREVSGVVTGWKRESFALSDEADRVEAVCRRVVAREEHWTYDAESAPRKRALVFVGALFFALAAGLLVRFGFTHVSLFAAFFPAAGAAALLLAGVRAARGGEPAMADSLLGGALVALVPALLAILQRTALLAALGPYGVSSWVQISAASGLAGAAAVALLYFRKRALYSWIAAAAFVLAWGAGAGAAGLLAHGALVLTPLALFLVVAQQLEAHERFDWMRPFLLAGLAALAGVPLYAALFDGLTPLPGVEVAVVGLLWSAAGAILVRNGGLALRAAGRWMSALAPGLLLAGLVWHSLANADIPGWLGVLGVGAALTTHGAVLRRTGTLAWGVTALLAVALIPALRGLATPWTVALLVGVLGLGAALVTGIASVRPRSL